MLIGAQKVSVGERLKLVIVVNTIIAIHLQLERDMEKKTNDLPKKLSNQVNFVAPSTKFR